MAPGVMDPETIEDMGRKIVSKPQKISLSISSD